MLQTHYCIIGAGVVGLAIAEKLSRSKSGDVLIIERHDTFGRETSSRNSEVIHAGLYYTKETLRTQLSITGNRLLYALCQARGISYKKIGKLVVATDAAEEQALHTLFNAARSNGVERLRMVSRQEVAGLEPAIVVRSAFFSPTTGIIDTHGLMRYFERRAEEQGAIFAYNCTATAIARASSGYTVAVNEADSPAEEVACAVVINSAGLMADAVAAMAGIDIDKAGYRLHLCKGEYFKVANRHKSALRHLIYPVPTPISLGIHTVLDLGGGLKLGPNAFYSTDTGYQVDETHAGEFLDSARTYLPFIQAEDLTPDMAGIRPKLQGPRDPARDFLIREESDKGLPGFVNLIGMESPALTSCCAIADYVASLLNLAG
jgi:L-2-hydroxyglutarate oxidase LhgO